MSNIEDDGYVTVYQTGSKADGEIGKKGSRQCNRHFDCEAADAKAKAAGRFSADHCHDDCCEDCFGS